MQSSAIALIWPVVASWPHSEALGWKSLCTTSVSYAWSEKENFWELLEQSVLQDISVTQLAVSEHLLYTD